MIKSKQKNHTRKMLKARIVRSQEGWQGALQIFANPRRQAVRVWPEMSKTRMTGDRQNPEGKPCGSGLKCLKHKTRNTNDWRLPLPSWPDARNGNDWRLPPHRTQKIK